MVLAVRTKLIATLIVVSGISVVHGEAKPESDIAVAEGNSAAASSTSSLQTFETRSTLKIVFHDDIRDREIPLRITVPDGFDGKCPIIIWSHCEASSGHQYRELIKYWASHGYVCIQPFHKSTSDSGNVDYWLQREKDVSFIIENLESLKTRHHVFANLVDLKRIGVGGHGEGAHTAQLIAGATMRDGEVEQNNNVDCFVFISPQGPNDHTRFAEDSWKHMDRPSLFVTGTNDNAPSGEDWRWRLTPFLKSPPKDKFMLFVEEANSDFGGIVKSPTEVRQVEYVKSVTLAFWNAQLKEDNVGRAYLRSDYLAQETSGEAQIFDRESNQNKDKVLAKTQGKNEPTPVLPMTLRTIQNRDKDGNGMINRREMPTELMIGFDIFDRNHNGSLTEKELDWGIRRVRVTKVR
ncbi:MAG: hypothetical protein KDB27_14280 [Planctomycetales bacterium]|nr:hypothetical protein [Planctomycetales bacterium]